MSITSLSHRLKHYFHLTKPRITFLVLVTGFTGMWLASGETFPATPVLIGLIGIGLGSCSAGALNNFIDRDIDPQMNRTQNRPLPRGSILPVEALSLGILLGLAGTFLLAYYVNFWTAGFLVFTILFYVLVYTLCLKRTTPLSTEIGGIAGAMPPVIGWFVIQEPSLSVQNLWPPAVLFALMFAWQGPHFWALGIMYRDDYKRADIPIFPVVADDHVTKKRILIYSILMVGFSLLLHTTGITGPIYLVSASIMGAAFLTKVVLLHQKDTTRSRAGSLFSWINLYLFVLFCFMLIDAS